MVLSGLILLPLLAIPTLCLLKKNFQIKLFYGAMVFIHLIFLLGILTKHGYLFDGEILGERSALFKQIGLYYSVSLNGFAVLTMIVIDFTFLIFGTVSINKADRAKAILLTLSHASILLSLLSSNLLLSVLATIIYLLTIADNILLVKKSSLSAFRFLFGGTVALIGVCMVFGILYQSVYGHANLNISALQEMRTPFVKGSIYSTQLVLFAFYTIGFAGFFVYSMMCCLAKGLKVDIFRPLFGIFLSLYVSSLYSEKLFPEASRFYSLSLKNQNSVLATAVLLIVFVLLAKKSIESFLERSKYV